MVPQDFDRTVIEYSKIQQKTQEKDAHTASLVIIVMNLLSNMRIGDSFVF